MFQGPVGIFLDNLNLCEDDAAHAREVGYPELSEENFFKRPKRDRLTMVIEFFEGTSYCLP